MLTAAQSRLLLEAAGHAPSAGNSQPWGFRPALRGDPVHRLIVGHLAPSSARWAPDASALIVTAARRAVGDMPYSDFADYDLGQAVAHLTIQAEAMGLACHQFRAFDLGGLTDDLRPAPGWAIMSVVAVGRSVDETTATPDRMAIDELVTAAWEPDRA
ncbi:hypothetical protein GCM10023147_07930 [Tsukamurella soli]|uniref:Nitroreductase n=1 Tax=Tsukamurella soli TaxID=644556 RepID=A0ABP8J686_9ACTN